MNCSLGGVKCNRQWRNTRPTQHQIIKHEEVCADHVLSFLGLIESSENFSCPTHLLSAINSLRIEEACEGLTHGERNWWERKERQKPQEVLLHPVHLSTGHYVVIIQTYKKSESAWREKKRKIGFYSQFSHLLQSASCSIWTPPSSCSTTAARFDFVLVETSLAAALLLSYAISFSSVMSPARCIME